MGLPKERMKPKKVNLRVYVANDDSILIALN